MKLRSKIDDGLIRASKCAVCDSPALHVVHLVDFADYVVCDACGSSFVMEEDGARVLYGEVSEQYPETEKAILKTWMSLEEVEQLARAERPDRVPPLTVDAETEGEVPKEAAVAEAAGVDVSPMEPGWMDLSGMNALDDLHPGEMAAASGIMEPDAGEAEAEGQRAQAPTAVVRLIGLVDR